MEDIMHKQNLALLLDFLNAIGKEKRKEFFYDNRENMDTLAWYYCHEFTNEFYKDQRNRLEQYRFGVCRRTKTKIGVETETETEIGKWWIHTDRVLGLYWGKKGEHRIGIECVFEKESYKYPLGKFHIYIASWDKDNFGSYEDVIKKTFSDRAIDEDKTAKNRAFILVKKFEPDETEDIINTLSDTYKKLNDIIKDSNK